MQAGIRDGHAAQHKAAQGRREPLQEVQEEDSRDVRYGRLPVQGAHRGDIWGRRVGAPPAVLPVPQGAKPAAVRPDKGDRAEHRGAQQDRVRKAGDRGKGGGLR